MTEELVFTCKEKIIVNEGSAIIEFLSKAKATNGYHLLACRMLANTEHLKFIAGVKEFEIIIRPKGTSNEQTGQVPCPQDRSCLHPLPQKER